MLGTVHQLIRSRPLLLHALKLPLPAVLHRGILDNYANTSDFVFPLALKRQARYAGLTILAWLDHI